MNPQATFLQRHARKLAAAAIVLVLYGLARLPELSSRERDELAGRFRFETAILPTVASPERRTIRDVHPSLAMHAAWISSVGAAIALNDLDHDGRPNDVCYVDVRTNQVIVSPAPGTGERYRPFALDPGPLTFDAQTTAPMGCVPNDMNEDGLLDVLVTYWGRTPIAFLRVGSSAGAEPTRDAYRAVDLVPTGERWYTNASTFADVDGDGHCDLIIGNYFQDDAWILNPHASGREQMQDSMSRAFNAGSNRLLLWRGASAGDAPDVVFEDVGGVFPERVTHAWTLAIAAADLDGDLLPELYFANDFGPDRLLHNRSRRGEPAFVVANGRKTLTMPNSKVLGRDSFKGMGADFADINGDGHFDLYVSNIADEYALHESHFLYVNTGEPERLARSEAPFVDQSEPLGVARSGWGWESRLADFDNDGALEAIQATGFVRGTLDRWPELQELAIGNDDLLRHPEVWFRCRPGDGLSGNEHNYFFVQSRSGRFFDVAREVGLGATYVTRGIATADIDGDGDLDAAFANQWEDSTLHLNVSPARGRSLVLHLRVPIGDDEQHLDVLPGPPVSARRCRAAIGAVARLGLPDGRRLVNQVDGGNGHSGARSHEVHFGLGEIADDELLAVDLAWRDAKGHVQQATVSLTPGEHTIMLGSARLASGGRP